MNHPRAAIAIGVGLLVSACQSGPHPCQRLHSSPPLPTLSIAPGAYRLILHADAGPKGGAQLVTRLRLSTFPPDSGRPQSHLAFGSLRGDLYVVGAPPCGDGPSPESHNQSSPGVLLQRDPDGALGLWVGSAMNQYEPGIIRTDGCGVYLSVESVSAKGFRGVWGAAGIVDDGACGSFVAEGIE